MDKDQVNQNSTSKGGQSKRKRLQSDSDNNNWKKVREEQPDLEQMGLAMLDSDESSSSSSSGETILIPESEYETSAEYNNYDELETTTSSDDNNINTVPNYPNISVGSGYQKIVENIDTPNGPTTVTKIIVYSDPTMYPSALKAASGRAIKNTSRLNTSTSSKGRSPLATVSNNINNNIQQLTHENLSPNSKKHLNLIADERFFLYRKDFSNKSPQCNEDYFSKISDEVILSIFKWLPKKALIRCTLVSKQFNRVSQDETLWSRLDLGGKSLKGGTIGSILYRGCIILRLAQTEIKEPIFKQQEPILLKAKLQYLDLSMACISILSLKIVLSKCRQLKKLSLEHVPVDDDVLYEIGQNSELEALNITMCDGLNEDNLLEITNGLKILRSLNISWASMTMEMTQVIVDTITPKILQLNIAGCRRTLTDAQVTTLIKRCPGLMELDLSDCTLLTSAIIPEVCKLKKLEYLSLSRCYCIHGSSYLSLGTIRSLAYLDVFGLLTDQAVTVLQSSFSKVLINKFIHSSVARPTVGTRRTSIWGLRTRD